MNFHKTGKHLRDLTVNILVEKFTLDMDPIEIFTYGKKKLIS